MTGYEVIGKEIDGTEVRFATTFTVGDAGLVIDEEGSTWFADIPTLTELVIRPLTG